MLQPLDFSKLPESERLAPRPSKPGTLDLTSARVLIECVPLQEKLIAAVDMHATQGCVH
jgi:hypothetical protein